jgi:hypothetical protein
MSTRPSAYDRASALCDKMEAHAAGRITPYMTWVAPIASEIAKAEAVTRAEALAEAAYVCGANGRVQAEAELRELIARDRRWLAGCAIPEGKAER